MTAKEYLLQIRTINRQIDRDMEEACRVRSLAERVTMVISPIQSKGGPDDDRIQSAVEELERLEVRIVDSIHRLVVVRDEVMATIDHLENPQQREVLRQRYILGKQWEQICVDMGYSWRSVHYFHSEALQKIAHRCTPKDDIL